MADGGAGKMTPEESECLIEQTVKARKDLVDRIGEVINDPKTMEEFHPEDRTWMIMDALFQSLRKFSGTRVSKCGGPLGEYIDAPKIVGDTRDPDLGVHIQHNENPELDKPYIDAFRNIVASGELDHLTLDKSDDVEQIEEWRYRGHRWASDGTYRKLYHVVPETKPPYLVIDEADHPARKRFWLMLDSTRIRHQSTLAKTERVARKKLEKMLSPTQCECYEVDGSFFETSKCSGVTYLLRKNRPTIAMKIDHDLKTVRYLTALCMHPFGFHEGTWVGVMAPSDEIIAHLLYIRADEHGFWKKANHLPLTAIQSGV